MENRKHISTTKLYPFVIAAVVVVISFVTAYFGFVQGLAIAVVPLVVLLLFKVIQNPFYGFILLFIFNYFIIAIMRYSGLSGLSVIVDVIMALVFVAFALNAAFGSTGFGVQNQASLLNGLVFVASLWFIYCLFELFNPTAMTNVWLLNRGLTAYMLAVVLLTFVVFKNYHNLNTIVMLLSVLVLLSVAKALMQKYIGFDAAEQRDLNEGLANTHLLATGTRYFSIYVSAGIFGAVMGHAMVVFGILSLYTHLRWKRIYFIIVALVSLYGLLISGTRGALAVPMAGLCLFTILSKRLKLMIPTAGILVVGYLFLAMTTIGQSNYLIRRMRTAFDPNEPSLIVRKENQKLFAAYLSDKPFGEGVGLSGVDTQHLSMRYTTSIPTDSWYVKIWVETGIVGLCLHLFMLAYIIIYGSWIILFRIRDYRLRGMLTALHCGVFGILASSYGNQVLGQFPVAIIVYMSMALVFMGPYFDRQITGDTLPWGTRLINK
ncbi:MAG: O-antigen ligase family protein [Mucinivorans sp.]